MKKKRVTAQKLSESIQREREQEEQSNFILIGNTAKASSASWTSSKRERKKHETEFLSLQANTVKSVGELKSENKASGVSKRREKR